MSFQQYGNRILFKIKKINTVEALTNLIRRASVLFPGHRISTVACDDVINE